MFQFRQKGNRTKRGIICLLVIFIIAFSTSGCTTFSNFMSGLEEEEEIPSKVRIGVFQPLSGEDKDFGELELQGIELAHELYPEVLGKPVELVYGDNNSEITAAETIARELVNKQVSVVLGSYGNTLSLAGGGIFEEAEVPAIAITCSNPLVTNGNPFYFRVCYVDSFQGIAAAKYIFEDLNEVRAAVMKDRQNDQAAALAQMFTDKMIAQTEDDNAVSGSYDYKAGETDFSSQLQSIQSAGIKVVYLPVSINDAAAIITQAKALKLDLIFIGTDDWDTKEFLETGGMEIEGALFTSYFDEDSSFTEMTDAFLTAYKGKYGEDSHPDSAVALGFDAYILALDAITRAETAVNGGAVREKLQKTKQFQGATGSITFDDNGDPIKSVAVMTVENGTFVLKSTAEPIWNPQY